MMAGRAYRNHAFGTGSLVYIGALLALAQIATAGGDPGVSTSGPSDAPPAIVEAQLVSAASAVATVSAQPDPVAMLQEAQRRCAEEVQEYSCVFLRQERIDGKLTKEQTVDVRYRANPRSVYMTWVRNKDQVKRALYIKGRNVDKKGQEQVLIEPAGALIRLVVDEVNIPVRGKRARKASRYTIDQFGFHSTLERINHDNERFARLGVLDWKYEGESSVDGRATFVLVRRLPYTGPNGRYSNARLVVNLDQERMLPLSVHSYADEREKVMLGSYVTTQVELNPGFEEVAFKF